MKDDYHINLAAITLSDYERELEEAELLLSRQMLKHDLHENFEKLRSQGLQNLADLLAAVKTAPKLTALAQKANLPEAYLVLLKREIASNLPKPVALKDFQAIPGQAIEKLAGLGIQDTHQLFQHVKTAQDRQQLCQKSRVSMDVILELTRLSDVSRIRWVGANFARLLVDSDCDTVEKVMQADYVRLYNDLMKINEEKQYFKGKFGLNDMKRCVLAAKIVPLVIDYGTVNQ